MKRKHELSQHFLSSPELVYELIGHSNIRPSDTVYDLGAGSGVITEALSNRCARVVAVESDAETLAKLRQNMSRQPNVAIVDGDLLEVELPSTDYKVFSNIPFSISSELVRRLTSAASPPESIYLIVQKQFARKLVPSDRHFTAQLGAEIAPWWQARIRRPLRRTDFTPPPAVDTVLLEIKPRSNSLLPEADKAIYRELVQTGYTRQKIFASWPREQVGIDSERKPSELTPEQWVALYKLKAKS